jgi:hypothetical protein
MRGGSAIPATSSHFGESYMHKFPKLGSCCPLQGCGVGINRKCHGSIFIWMRGVGQNAQASGDGQRKIFSLYLKVSAR